MPRSRLPAALVMAAIVGVTTPGYARASGTPAAGTPTTADINEARERFMQGRKLEDEGRFAEALELFKRVGEVKMTPQVRFHLALCLENTGRIAEALEAFQLAAQEAGSTAPNVVKEANEHIAPLDKRVPTLTVSVTQSAPGDELTLDGRPITADVPLRAEPGAHTAAVRRDGRVVAERKVTLEEGKSAHTELAVGEDTQPGRVQRILGWSALGVAAASAISMGVFAALRADKVSEVEAVCLNFSGCPRNVEPLVEDGRTYSTLVNVFAGVSGAAAVTGVILLLSAPSAAPPSRSGNARGLRLSPVLAPGQAFVSVEGRF